MKNGGVGKAEWWQWLVLLAWMLASTGQLSAQTYETNNVSVQTFVGSGFYGLVDGQGTQTMFNNPSGIVVDSANNFFVLDDSNYRIRKVTPDGVVSTFVGGGTGGIPGYGTNVSLQSYYYSFGPVVIDHANVIWLISSSTLLRVAPDGLVLSVPLTGVSNPAGLCVDSKNNLYVSDSSGNRIYRFRTNYVLELFVGSGNPGAVDGNGIFTSFYSPTALTADAADNVYVADSGNSRVRRINQNRDVVTIAGKPDSYYSMPADGTGTNAIFGAIQRMTTDAAGNLILVCGSYYGSGSAIRKMTPANVVTTIAGNFNTTGYANGSGSQALFGGASDVCVSQGSLFVADRGNQRIRRINFDVTPVSPGNLSLNTYAGLQINGNPGRTYQIESSTNLTSWTAETTLVLPSSPYLWIDLNGVGQKKFYRAIMLP